MYVYEIKSYTDIFSTALTIKQIGDQNFLKYLAFLYLL